MKSLANYYESDNYLKGTLGKDIIKSLLERSGYTVCFYGYEETLLDAKSKYTYKKWNSKTGRRLTSSPDLLVYDDKDIMMLVEIKTRGKSRWVEEGEVWIKRDELESLRDFWSDSILAVVVPVGNVFYARRISELRILQGDKYPLSDFQSLRDIFTRVSSEAISHYKDITLQLLAIFMTEREKKSLEMKIANTEEIDAEVS